jgi:hypothetical protein
MSRNIPPLLRRSLAAAGLGAVLLAPLASLSPAQAWWRGGGVFVGIPGPVVVGPPVIYAPPPVYYAPPPVYYAPPPGYPAPQSFAAEPGRTCYAGSYVCPLGQAYPLGAACSCPTGHGPAHGQAH